MSIFDDIGGSIQSNIFDPFKGVTEGITGESAAEAAQQASQIQSEATQQAIEEQRAAREQYAELISPFREAGVAQLPELSSLISNPQAQAAFVQQNPFFNTLAGETQRRLFSSQAARGKVGSGGTAEALQTSLLGLGSDLLSRNISQRMNLATLGANVTAGQATAGQQSAANIGNLITSGANAQAAGLVGAAQARQQGLQNLLTLGTNALGLGLFGGLPSAGATGATGAGLASGGLGGLAVSDRRVKENIKQIGTFGPFPLYEFNYINDKKRYVNVMAQDVEKIYPESIIEFNGLKCINMVTLCRSIPVYH